MVQSECDKSQFSTLQNQSMSQTQFMVREQSGLQLAACWCTMVEQSRQWNMGKQHGGCAHTSWLRTLWSNDAAIPLFLSLETVATSVKHVLKIGHTRRRSYDQLSNRLWCNEANIWRMSLRNHRKYSSVFLSITWANGTDAGLRDCRLLLMAGDKRSFLTVSGLLLNRSVYGMASMWMSSIWVHSHIVCIIVMIRPLEVGTF